MQAARVSSLASDRARLALDWRAAPRRWREKHRRVVKVHGLLRSGTNYVSALWGENLDVSVLGPEKGGWKHGPIDESEQATVVVVVKNPYTWLESFYRWELIRRRTEAETLTEFASSPVSHSQLASVWGSTDPVDTWNKATASWVRAQDSGRVFVVRYEDVIVDIGRELQRFIEKFPTKRRHRTPVDITARVGPGWKTVGPVDRDHYAVDLPGLDGGLVALLRRADQDWWAPGLRRRVARASRVIWRAMQHRTDPRTPPGTGQHSRAVHDHEQGEPRSADRRRGGRPTPSPSSGPQRFTNRELSWLEFGARLLDLAEDERTPLLERVEVPGHLLRGARRVLPGPGGRLQGSVAMPDCGPARLTVCDRARPCGPSGPGCRNWCDRQSHIFVDEIAPQLAEAGIRLSDWSSLDDDDRDYLVDVFQRQIFPVLTPLSVDPGHPFPYISNLSLNLIVRVGDPVTGEERVARVKVPPLLPRFVVMPDGERFVALEQIIAAHLSTLFPDMVIGEHYAFRVTRNADLVLEEDEADDLLVAVEMELRRRRFGRAVRLEVAADMSADTRDMLIHELDLGPRTSTRRPLLSISVGCGPSMGSTDPNCRKRRGRR